MTSYAGFTSKVAFNNLNLNTQLGAFQGILDYALSMASQVDVSICIQRKIFVVAVPLNLCVTVSICLIADGKLHELG